MHFYLAARYARRNELQAYKADLVERGHSVPARWLSEAHTGETNGVNNERYAREDVEDVLAAHAIVHFTEPPWFYAGRWWSAGQGGRRMEMGLALATHYVEGPHDRMGLFEIGPKENIFDDLGEVKSFDTWPLFLAFLDKNEGKIEALIRYFHQWPVTPHGM